MFALEHITTFTITHICVCLICFSEVRYQHPVIDMRLLFEGETLPSGFVKNATDLHGGVGSTKVFLAYKRGTSSSGRPLVTDIRINEKNSMTGWVTDTTHVLNNGFYFHKRHQDGKLRTSIYMCYPSIKACKLQSGTAREYYKDDTPAVLTNRALNWPMTDEEKDAKSWPKPHTYYGNELLRTSTQANQCVNMIALFPLFVAVHVRLTWLGSNLCKLIIALSFFSFQIILYTN